MTYRLKLLPLAKIDIKDSRIYYNKKQPGLGKRFFLSVQLSFDLIKDSQELFAVRYQNIRTAPVRDFPFLIHYSIDLDRKFIIIFAVTHTSRNPDNWIERIK